MMAKKKKVGVGLGLILLALLSVNISGQNPQEEHTKAQVEAGKVELVPLAYTEDLADPNVDGYNEDVIISGRIE